MKRPQRWRGEKRENELGEVQDIPEASFCNICRELLDEVERCALPLPPAQYEIT
jgi:hypothetical protein